jgi:hypothetical protein
MKQAMAAAGVEEGFMTSIAPGSASRIGNTYYASEEEFVYACADVMREEYKAIIDAGLILQLDDPSIAENWDRRCSCRCPVSRKPCTWSMPPLHLVPSHYPSSRLWDARTNCRAPRLPRPFIPRARGVWATWVLAFLNLTLLVLDTENAPS